MLITRLLQNGIQPPPPESHSSHSLMLSIDGPAVGGVMGGPSSSHSGQRRKAIEQPEAPRQPPPKRARSEYHDKPYSEASLASTLNKRTKSIKAMCDHVTSRARGSLSIIITFIYRNNKYDTRVFGDLVTTDTERETRLEDYIHATFSKAANVHHPHGQHSLMGGLDPTKALDSHGGGQPGGPAPLDDFVIRSECSRDELLRVYRRAMRRLTKRAQPGFFDPNRKPDGFPDYLWKKPDKLSRDEVATALRWCQQQMGNGIVLPTSRQMDQAPPPPQHQQPQHHHHAPMQQVPILPPIVPPVNVPYSGAGTGPQRGGPLGQGTILAATAVQAAQNRLRKQ